MDWNENIAQMASWTGLDLNHKFYHVPFKYAKSTCLIELNGHSTAAGTKLLLKRELFPYKDGVVQPVGLTGGHANHRGGKWDIKLSQ